MEWIKVCDRFPEEEGYYLVSNGKSWVKCKLEKGQMFYLNYNEYFEYMICPMIYWLSIPKIPESS